jgi:heat shock protein HslJ
MSDDHARTLAGTTWTITEARGGEEALVAVVAGPHPPILRFDDERLSGSSGCNNFMGACHVDGSAIAVSLLATTMMMCPDDAMRQERRILSALEAAVSFSMAGTVLQVHDARGICLTAIRENEDIG